MTCQACGLAASRTQPVCGNAHVDAMIMLLGEAPGAVEDRVGMPFQGQAGQVLEQFLAATGIAQEQLYIGNTVKCRPVRNGKRGMVNRKPTVAEMMACRPHLEAEITLLNPRLIVTLGAVPLRFFLGVQPKMSEWHGCLFVESRWGKEIFPLYHPAAVIYDRRLAQTYQDDLQTLRQLLQARGLG